LDNQHKKITGYRDLTQDEIDLMNEIKAHEAATAALLGKVRKLHAAPCGVPADPLARAAHFAAGNEPARQLSIARTEFEGAFMRLVRSVAQPATPWA
jgi:hypothetical protein